MSNTVKEELYNALKELIEKELKEFKWRLNSIDYNERPNIPRASLENAEAQDVVDLLIQHYGEDALEVCIDVLRKCNRNDLAEKLEDVDAHQLPDLSGNLAVASLPARMASGSAVLITSNEANKIQTAPGLPNVALQASGATPYSQYGAQQLGIPTSSPQQVPQKSPLERFLKAEPKVLGAVQILIGLIHIGFGAVSLLSNYPEFHSVSAIGGYPFWGGIFFISSGSLCVSAANSPNHALVKSSAGLNITSAIMSLVGIFLYIGDLIIYSRQYATDRLSSVNYGLASVLLLFSMLEFCITVSLAHFRCQAACCIDDQRTVMFMPTHQRWSSRS